MRETANRTKRNSNILSHIQTSPPKKTNYSLTPFNLIHKQLKGYLSLSRSVLLGTPGVL